MSRQETRIIVIGHSRVQQFENEVYSIFSQSWIKYLGPKLSKLSVKNLGSIFINQYLNLIFNFEINVPKTLICLSFKSTIVSIKLCIAFPIKIESISILHRKLQSKTIRLLSFNFRN